MAFLHNASLNQLSDGGFVLRGEPMSNMAMLELLKDMSHTDFTVQGIRSTSKTWCEEETNLSNQAVEFCIAHLPGDEAEKALSAPFNARKAQADHGVLDCLRRQAKSQGYQHQDWGRGLTGQDSWR
jgi:hypothetical protein